ncbi:ammonia-dependent NAD(+) synthetase [Photobacterium japonica]
MSEFDAKQEIDRRITFLANTLQSSGLNAYVLGVSGGVDSSAAARLAQLAVEKLRSTGYDAFFVAVRLPYGTQLDESDAQAALDYICPDHVHTVNIQAAADALHNDVVSGMHGLRGLRGLCEQGCGELDFAKGNVKARQRMVAQYEIAGLLGGLVIGTDHNAEAVMGFYTKFGDGACDVTPLVGLNKRQVRLIAKTLGLPKALYTKAPTADLESEKPQLLDEDVLMVTYDEIDDYLEGISIPEKSARRIENQFLATAHKRAMPIKPD